ncbi:MAG: S8 family peptidase, partial [Vicinamibacterales bacterium]
MAAVAGVVLFFSSVAFAAEHRARLSSDLEQHLRSGSHQRASVILSGTASETDAIAARHGATIKKRLRHGVVLDVSPEQLAALAADPAVPHLSGDATVHRMMALSAQAIGADQVQSGIGGLSGFTGRGVGVAVIDSGIANHKALNSQVIASLDFTGDRHGRDEYGHGTHVAGIIAGGSEASYAGVAPGAHIVSLRVLGADGSGSTSDVIAAIDWAIANRARYGLRIINLSLGRPVFESYREDPLCQAAQRAVDAGLVVIASAGNFGKTPDGQPIVGGIVSPGNLPDAITVGALNTKGTAMPSDDVVASFSSRGLTHIDGVLKPELVAPGNRVVAAAAHGSAIVNDYPERLMGGEGNHAYIELSGTSMAAAVVSGAAALLLEAAPGLTPADVKLALQVTSSRVAGAGLIEAGAGSLNVAAATLLVTGQ